MNAVGHVGGVGPLQRRRVAERSARRSAEDRRTKHLQLPPAAEQLLSNDAAALASTVFDGAETLVSFTGNLGDILGVNLKEMAARQLLKRPSAEARPDKRSQILPDSRSREELDKFAAPLGTDQGQPLGLLANSNQSAANAPVPLSKAVVNRNIT